MITPFHWLWRMCMAWWRHQSETFTALLAICAGNSPITGEFPAQRPVMFSLTWINGWVNNREAGDLGRHRAHYDVIVMDNIVWNQTTTKHDKAWAVWYFAGCIVFTASKTYNRSSNEIGHMVYAWHCDSFAKMTIHPFKCYIINA